MQSTSNADKYRRAYLMDKIVRNGPGLFTKKKILDESDTQKRDSLLEEIRIEKSLYEGDKEAYEENLSNKLPDNIRKAIAREDFYDSILLFAGVIVFIALGIMLTIGGAAVLGPAGMIGGGALSGVLYYGYNKLHTYIIDRLKVQTESLVSMHESLPSRSIAGQSPEGDHLAEHNFEGGPSASAREFDAKNTDRYPTDAISSDK